MNRRAAYSWLAHQMNISVKNTHISWFNNAQCEIAITLAKDYLTKSIKK